MTAAGAARPVILDRDGTVIIDRHYLDDPAQGLRQAAIGAYSFARNIPIRHQEIRPAKSCQMVDYRQPLEDSANMEIWLSAIQRSSSMAGITVC